MNYPQVHDTALIVACQKNDLATVSVLLKAGASPNVCNKVAVSSSGPAACQPVCLSTGWADPTTAGCEEEERGNGQEVGGGKS